MISKTEAPKSIIGLNDIFSKADHKGFNLSGKSTDAEPVNAEVVDDEKPEPIKALDIPAPHYLPLFWRPYLQYPLTDKTLSEIARTAPFDPARWILGFSYDARLKLESGILIPYPIPSYYPMGILKALEFRRSNPLVFVCWAIDVVLSLYLKNTIGDIDDVQ